MRNRYLARLVGLCAALALVAATASAQGSNPRFGKWKLKSEAPAPASNIMTYEPFGAKGMKVTVESVNAKGEKSAWWYTTEFDGKEMPVTGQQNAMTSVRTINDRINEIINKRDGKITQILTNVLSPDSNTIGVMYMRMDPEGKKTTNVTFATYERIQ
jgi:hypothetical protein